MIGVLTVVLLFVALAAKTHDTAPVTDAVPAAEDTSAAAEKEVVRKKKHPAKKARRAKKSAAPTLVVNESGEPIILSSGGSDGSGDPAPQEPSRKIRVDRGSEKGVGREQVEVVPPTVTEETPVPEPQPLPEPQPEPQPPSRRPASPGSASRQADPTSRAGSD